MAFIRGLKKAGLPDIEAGAFVRADKVPQMADSEKVFKQLRARRALAAPNYWALVPNIKGLERALEAGVGAISVFTAATETFNQRNIGMSIAESLAQIREIAQEARRHKIKTRGYVSTVFGCPFEGKTAPKKAIHVATRLLELGVGEVSLGDTIGVATPADVDPVIAPLVGSAGARRLAVHFHDTRGTALANTYRALEWGISTVDASAGGLGGCPFAPGATGNLATEDLVYMLEGLKIRTGVNLETLCKTSLELAQSMGRPLSSRYLSAYQSTCARGATQ